MNESLQEHVDLQEFSLFAGVDGLAPSGSHRRPSHHPNHHNQRQHQQQHQHPLRCSRIPRPIAADSRRNSTITTSDVTYNLSLPLYSTSSATFSASFEHPPAIYTSATAPPESSQAATDTTLAAYQMPTTPATKNSTSVRLGAEMTAAEETSGKPSRSHKRSASTWETHQTLADLWTEFQKPSSFSTS